MAGVRGGQDKATKSADFPAIADDQLGKEHVLAFASKIFLRSDNEDRAGNATSYAARSGGAPLASGGA